jgi:hypothetical protein
VCSQHQHSTFSNDWLVRELVNGSLSFKLNFGYNLNVFDFIVKKKMYLTLYIFLNWDEYDNLEDFVKEKK